MCGQPIVPTLWQINMLCCVTLCFAGIIYIVLAAPFLLTGGAGVKVYKKVSARLPPCLAACIPASPATRLPSYPPAQLPAAQLPAAQLPACPATRPPATPIGPHCSACCPSSNQQTSLVLKTTPSQLALLDACRLGAPSRPRVMLVALLRRLVLTFSWDSWWPRAPPWLA